MEEEEKMGLTWGVGSLVRTGWDYAAEKVTVTEEIANTLAERGKRYGCFTGHAKITQDIKRAMASAPKYESLDDDQKEALEMFAHKIGRILNGDPNYHDSWHDLVGYATLVADRLANGAKS
jgi:glutamyl/glutaminyl-tRNA synthetase